MWRMRIVAIAFGIGLLLPASAMAWSSAYRLSPPGSVEGAELNDAGVLRVWWEGYAQSSPRSGVWLVRHTGNVKRVRPAALDKFTYNLVDNKPSYEEPLYLRNGDALRCAITVNDKRMPSMRRARVHLLEYSPAGSFLKRITVATQAEAEGPTAAVAPACHLATAGGHTVIEFTQQTPSTDRYQSNRQIYVARVLHGLRVSSPIPVLSPGVAQQTFIPANLAEQVGVSRTGWIAVSWAQDNITAERGNKVSQRWQFDMSWVSPSGTVGPVIKLAQSGRVRMCGEFSPKCGLDPPTPSISVVGPKRVLVVFGYPHLSSEEVDAAGLVSTPKVILHDAPFTSPVSGQVASGGGTVVVTWAQGYTRHPRCTPIHVMQWRRGRWGRPVVVGRPSRKDCLLLPSAHTNERGQASVIWWHQIDESLGYAEGVFNF